MDILKNQIINNILNLLSPIKETDPFTYNTITNDLINGKIESLNNFINTNYQNLNYRSEIKDFIKKLVDNNLLDTSYKDIIKDNYQFIDLTVANVLKINSKPLNVKEIVLEKILKNTPPTILNIINHEYAEISFNDVNLNDTEANNFYDEVTTPNPYLTNVNSNEINLSDIKINQINDEDKAKNNDQKIDLNEFPSQPVNNLSDTNIETSNHLNQVDINDLRKKILDAQLNYINNASSFISELEKEDANNIYNSLIDLNDLRYIQHSLSKLSKETLERILEYTQDKLNKNNHSSIDMFIISAIKKYLH